ncbi:hypothetical protein [Scytonema sp. PRP1]|uniref:hypothetical protein n=1 Tax=Scytonema sp. PRP1 TaxID=3120513 RepID=UPI002FCE8429
MKPEIKFKQTCFLLLPLLIAQVGVAQMPQLLAAQGAIAPLDESISRVGIASVHA